MTQSDLLLHFIRSTALLSSNETASASAHLCSIWLRHSYIWWKCYHRIPSLIELLWHAWDNLNAQLGFFLPLFRSLLHSQDYNGIKIQKLKGFYLVLLEIQIQFPTIIKPFSFQFNFSIGSCVLFGFLHSSSQWKSWADVSV